MDHNLSIESYSFAELLGLFGLEENNIQHDDLKRAKKKVLMMHPDKSKLGPEYFLFYKKAFDVIVGMYENVLKMSLPVENKEYVAEKSAASNKEMKKKFTGEAFQKKFNDIFDKHGTKTLDHSRNDWFTSTDALYEDTAHAQNHSQINGSIDRIKERQQQMIAVPYKGVVPSASYGGNGLYDDDYSDGEYLECDPFSKLKFDDLRKVHKDQTVFAVRESDLANVTQYKNVDEYKSARYSESNKPMERSRAEIMIQEQERIIQEKMRQKQYQAELNIMRSIETNKKVMANFLQLH